MSDDIDFPPKATEAEKKRAVADPGTPWGEWFYASMLRLYIPVTFLVLDSWLIGAWLESGSVLGVLLTLPPALYGEFAGYEYLWAKPRGDRSYSTRSEFRPTIRHPFEFGRWTPEGRRVRAGLPPFGEGQRPPGEPDPTEFF